MYFECQDRDETVSRLKARGIEFDYDPQDQPWLWREGRLKDLDGNRICLFSAGSTASHRLGGFVANNAASPNRYFLDLLHDVVALRARLLEQRPSLRGNSTDFLGGMQRSLGECIPSKGERIIFWGNALFFKKEKRGTLGY